MKLDFFKPQPHLPPEKAKNLLIHILQNAHAGEKAAANAYWGHANSPFVRDQKEKEEILKIYDDELHHRIRLKFMLDQLGGKPRLGREIIMYLIGATIAFLCIFGGWFIPMYGAGKLESTNIEEYEVAFRLAYLSGNHEFIDELIQFAEIEWDHEVYFADKAKDHFLLLFFKMWERPLPKETIRATFEEFKALYSSP
jgi:hypothetical protein